MKVEPSKLVGRILVVDDETSMREFLSICLARAGHEVRTADGGKTALKSLESSDDCDLVITDLRMDEISGLDVLKKARQRTPPAEVLIVTAYATPESAVAAIKLGAYDYLTKPFRVDDVLHGVSRALERHRLQRENLALREQLQSKYELGQLIGKSTAMRRVFDLVRKVAPTRTNVLLLGESGTGKEKIASAIHSLSPRAQGPFVPVNCGAIPETLMESELFGHIKGAFTGAITDKDGLFVAANGGTLFLDEIAEIPPGMQVKLLRVIQERRVKPVGGVEEEEVDVRIIAATNRDLLLAVEEGRFREDLYYRLNVISVQMPALRQRREDIPKLVDHFARRFAAEQQKDIRGVAPTALERLTSYHYPGNVRELENLIERAVTLASGSVIEVEQLGELAAVRSSHRAHPQLTPEGIDLDNLVGEIERDLLCQALEHTKGVRTEAARILGITLRSLRYRLDKHGIGADSDDAPQKEK